MVLKIKWILYHYFSTIIVVDIMITNYEIRNIDNEDIVILYLDYSLEIGSFDKIKSKNLVFMVKDYLKKLKFNKNYQKILVMCSGILVATIFYIGNDIKIVSNDSLKIEPIVIEKIDTLFNTPLDSSVLSSPSNSDIIEKKEEQIGNEVEHGPDDYHSGVLENDGHNHNVLEEHKDESD